VEQIPRFSGEKDQMASLHYVIHVDYSINFMDHIDLQKRRKRFIDETGLGRKDIVLALRNQVGVLLKREMMKLNLPYCLNLCLEDKVWVGGT
jgi:hypothetical protein